jgi:hypothetical protein
MSISPHRSGYSSRAVHVRFMVDKFALGMCFFECFEFFLPCSAVKFVAI